MSIYMNSYPDWDAFWEALKDDSVSDLNALPAMDEMAVFGARDYYDSNSKNASAVLEATKTACGVEGTEHDEALINSYNQGYDNVGQFLASNPTSGLPPRPR